MCYIQGIIECVYIYIYLYNFDPKLGSELIEAHLQDSGLWVDKLPAFEFSLLAFWIPEV